MAHFVLLDYINREIYEQFRSSQSGKEDIHTRLMKKYKPIPNWWFHVTLLVSFLLALLLCTVMKDQVQMPWWGLIFAAGLALTFTLPISIITATTNQVFKKLLLVGPSVSPEWEIAILLF